MLWVSFRPPAPTRPAEASETPSVWQPPSSLPQGLTNDGLRRLGNWLGAVGAATPEPPARDIFREADAPPPVFEPTREEPAVSDYLPPLDAPRLAGFVMRGEDRETSRVLAAIRFEGRVWLVGEGEFVGNYRVQRIAVAEEEVFLVETVGGQESRLRIE